MITHDQAVYFLEGILRMPPNWRNLLQNRPLEFLTFYLKRHAVRVPFQNMDMAAVDEGHRWFPSEENLISTGLCGKGGCCINLNYFSMLVFRAIGLDTFVVRGDHYCAAVAGTHCLVMVKLHGPKDVGIYMIEVGGAYPMLEPVPMDRERLPYKTLQGGGFPYEFRGIAPGWIGRFHLGGGILGGAFTDKKETLRTCWNLQPRALWEFDYPMLETFTKPCYSVLLRAPFVYRFFSNSEFRRFFPELPENANSKEKVGKALIASGQRKVVPVKNGKGTVENGKTTTANSPKVSVELVSATSVATSEKTNDSGKGTLELTLTKMDVGYESEVVTGEDEESGEDLEDPRNWIVAYKLRIVVGDAKSRKLVKNYESYEEMAEDLKKYFPQISPKTMDKAMQTFSAYEPKLELYDTLL